MLLRLEQEPACKLMPVREEEPTYSWAKIRPVGFEGAGRKLDRTAEMIRNARANACRAKTHTGAAVNARRTE
jgi:hypothetical protein